MFLLNGLHSLAAERGDGLRPELLDLVARQRALREAGVVEIARRSANPFSQAGPNPTGICAALPENVVQIHETIRNGRQDGQTSAVLVKRSI